MCPTRELHFPSDRDLQITETSAGGPGVEFYRHSGLGLTTLGSEQRNIPAILNGCILARGNDPIEQEPTKGGKTWAEERCSILALQ